MNGFPHFHPVYAAVHGSEEASGAELQIENALFVHRAAHHERWLALLPVLFTPRVIQRGCRLGETSQNKRFAYFGLHESPDVTYISSSVDRRRRHLPFLQRFQFFLLSSVAGGTIPSHVYY